MSLSSNSPARPAARRRQRYRERYVKQTSTFLAPCEGNRPTISPERETSGGNPNVNICSDSSRKNNDMVSDFIRLDSEKTTASSKAEWVLRSGSSSVFRRSAVRWAQRFPDRATRMRSSGRVLGGGANKFNSTFFSFSPWQPNLDLPKVQRKRNRLPCRVSFCTKGLLPTCNCRPGLVSGSSLLDDSLSAARAFPLNVFVR